jgi:hypothetical protein
MEQNHIDVHQHVVSPFSAKALLPSRQRSLEHRYSSMVAQGCDELHGLPKDRDRRILSLTAPSIVRWNRSERREMAHRVNEYTTDLRARPTDRFGIFAALPSQTLTTLWREGLFMDRCRLQDGIDVEFVVPAATDEVLVAAANSGNHPAFDELWKRYSNTVFKVAYRITGNRDDAEDVIQDTWVKAYVRLKVEQLPNVSSAPAEEFS